MQRKEMFLRKRYGNLVQAMEPDKDAAPAHLYALSLHVAWPTQPLPAHNRVRVLVNELQAVL